MLLEQIKSLPNESGVYRYYNKNTLLYVGKAKNLKKRVKSYFVFTPKLAANPKNSPRIQDLIRHTTRLEYSVTLSELDALILENSLIKQLHPKYNILLRDDKTYPYICVDTSEEFARFEITRKVKNEPFVKYFGPYASGASELIDGIYQLYPLRQKKSCKKPCIFYQINRCIAPCLTKDKAEYDELLKQALNALKKPKIMLKPLEKIMFSYAKNENFELAAKTRDIIKSIEKNCINSNIDLAKDIDFEAYALASNSKFQASSRLIINHGRVVSVINEQISQNEGCLLSMQIMKNYKDGIIPNTIYVRDDFENRLLLEQLLSQRAKKKISIKIAKNNAILNLLEFGEENAKKSLLEQKAQIAKNLQGFFGLNCLPIRIESFDNSHFQAQAIKGAMVSFDTLQNEFIKANYRTYNLVSINDYAQMQEMLTRRILDFDKLNCPDLWVIDGGKALLDLALNLLAQNEINLEVIAISKEKLNHLAHRAKGAARDIIYYKDEVFRLDVNSEILMFLQKMRDEAHRFAISSHKKAKQKEDLQASKLQKIGVSKASLEKLIKYFGTFAAIYKASEEEIAEITNKITAAKIQNYKNLQAKNIK